MFQYWADTPLKITQWPSEALPVSSICCLEIDYTPSGNEVGTSWEKLLFSPLLKILSRIAIWPKFYSFYKVDINLPLPCLPMSHFNHQAVSSYFSSLHKDKQELSASTSLSRVTSGHNAVWTIMWLQRNTPYSSALRSIWCSLRRRFLCAKSNPVCHCFLKAFSFPRNLIDFASERNLAYLHLVEQISQSLATHLQDMLAHNKNSVKDCRMKA